MALPLQLALELTGSCFVSSHLGYSMPNLSHLPRLVARTLFGVVVLMASIGHSQHVEQKSQETVKRVFLIGDSTVKNGSGKGDRGQWGWGQVLQRHFDHERIVIENRALGGRSSRTYLTEGLWERTLNRVRPGDYVLMQFGHNDGGKKFEGNRPRASIKGNGDESQEGVVQATGKAEVVHSYGWYLRRYAAETKAKGATPIVLSLVPRDIWKNGRIIRASRDYGKWAKEAAGQADVLFLDLNQIVADRYEQEGREKVHNEYFTPADHTHTSKLGAKVNAECVTDGIRRLETCDLKEFLLPPSDGTVKVRFGGPQEEGVTVFESAEPYSQNKGVGFSPQALPDGIAGEAPGCVESEAPFSFSVRVAEGNHRVRLTLGNTTRDSQTRVECELRRRVLDDIETKPGERVVREFLVNTRTPVLPNGRRVKLKPRERDSEAMAWDNRLTLRFSGDRPSVSAIEVSPAPGVKTLYLLGDSTVADQPAEPWASWGQKLPRFFADSLAVANHSESGETIAAAWNAGRCDKVLDCLQSGDWVMIQFGHNDMKSKAADALERYQRDLGRLVTRCREIGGTPVLVTSMERMAGVENDTLGDYPDAVRELAQREGVALIDLHEMSKRLYRALGDQLPTAFQDGTHHTDYGAELLAACVVDGVRTSAPKLADRLSEAAPLRP